MQYSDPIILVDEVIPDTPDANGDQIPVEVEKGIIFGNVKSVSQNEFFAAEQAGMKATGIAEVWGEEYGGERGIIVNGVRYEIYRTYAPGERIELYYGQRVGKP